MQTGTQAIDRAAQLLVQVVEAEQPPTVGELAGSSGLPKSTVSRLLRALERNGLVQREGPRGGLRPGSVLVNLARRDGEADLIALAGPELRRLADRTGETVNLAVPRDGQAEYLAQIETGHFLGSTNWIGRATPNHSTAVGKVFLAFGAAHAPERLERLTPDTIVDPRRLEAELEHVRARGYATAAGELEPGLVAIAAPVRNAAGETIAAISVSGPSIRLTATKLAPISRLLAAETDALSVRLGYRHKGAA